MSSALAQVQSALVPIGPLAAQTASLAWVLIAAASGILLAVTVLTLYAAFAARRPGRSLCGEGLIVGGGIVFPALVLSALLAYSALSAADLGADDKDVLQIHVVGEQWWWRVHYLTSEGKLDFALANELRLPVGRTVALHLTSADVIHSFWVPALAGKLDMIPGRTHTLRLRADRPGRVRGQCAEYCGGPHGFMALSVVAHTTEDYARWAAAQRAPALGPSSETAREGRALFDARCAACHAVRGTGAEGTAGPDLTHIGTRLSLGAGRMPVDASTLAAWITSAQRLKPGNLMPEFRDLEGERARAIAQYLAGLS